MPARKRKPAASLPSRPGRVAALLRGPARPFVLAALLIGVLLGGWYAVWLAVRGRVLASNEYQVALHQVDVTPRPGWIHSDVRAEVFRDAGFDGRLSLMDEDLAERIGRAFASHPWIARVERVVTVHPSRVEVEVVYRRPACMVEVPGGLLPVDVQGVLLPVNDFSPLEAGRYPRLAGVDAMPLGSVGTRWGDERVIGGAEIADALGPLWQTWKLARIVPADSATTAARGEYVYELVTAAGTRIAWGLAPGRATAGELAAADKVARLKGYFDEHGTLEGPGGPQQLNVRDLRPVPGP